MLGNYEKRYFEGNEKIWIKRYKNLSNILHWHTECELIRIVSGEAEIKIGNNFFNGNAGDCFFCTGEELHHFITKRHSIIDVIIFHKNLLKTVTEKSKTLSPLLTNPEQIRSGFDSIWQILSQKPRFYTELLENCGEKLLLDVLGSNEICQKEDTTQLSKKIIDKINSDFATITFNEIIEFSGYSPSHFSKFFKYLTGMTFSDYLNFVKIEHAITLIQDKTDLTITKIALQCGFGSIRNFNRVFKKLTGFSPSNLPKDFTININIAFFNGKIFNPTSENSIVL